MPYIFLLLALGSIVFLIIGLFSPKTALFWKKGPVSRMQSVLFYIVAFVCCIVGIGITMPHKNRSANANTTAESEKASGSSSEYELAKSCDTNWRFINQADKYLNQKGSIVECYVLEIAGIDWRKGVLTISTYKQVGPATFEEDRKRRLKLDQPVQVSNVIKGRANNKDYYFLEVSPAGSSERYYIDEINFSLKDVNACTLLQKAKNNFLTRAEYTPDYDNRPTDDRDGSSIDVPEGAHILVKKYSELRNTIIGTLYDKRGGLMVPHAHFQPSTLREAK